MHTSGQTEFFCLSLKKNKVILCICVDRRSRVSHTDSVCNAWVVPDPMSFQLDGGLGHYYNDIHICINANHDQSVLGIIFRPKDRQ